MARYGYIDKPSDLGNRWNNVYKPATRRYIAESTKLTLDELAGVGVQGGSVYPIAEIMVHKPAEVALPDPQLIEPTSRAKNDFGHDVRNAIGYDVSDNEVQQVMAQQVHTPQMFVSRPGKITDAFADQTMRHSAGKLFGKIMDDFRGHRMLADASLSRHSSKLVQRAVAAGFLEPNPYNVDGVATNYADFGDQYATSIHTNFERNDAGEWSQDEVDRSTKDLISRLRNHSVSDNLRQTGQRGQNLNEQQFAKPGDWGPREPEGEQLALF